MTIVLVCYLEGVELNPSRKSTYFLTTKLNLLCASNLQIFFPIVIYMVDCNWEQKTIPGDPESVEKRGLNSVWFEFM